MICTTTMSSEKPTQALLRARGGADTTGTEGLNAVERTWTCPGAVRQNHSL